MIYRLYKFEGSSVPLGITNYFDIVMENFISHNLQIVYGDTIIFKSNDDNQVFNKSLNKFDGLADSAFDKENPNGQLNFQYILQVQAADIIQKVLKCDQGSRRIYGQLFMMKTYFLDKKLNISGKIFPSRFDAYFYILEKDKKMFCEVRNDLELIFVIYGFIAVIGLLVLIKIMHLLYKKSKEIIVGDATGN